MAYRNYYPFKNFKVSKFNIQTKKRAIPKSDILKIMKVDLKKEKPTVQFAKDLFVFTYLCNGINLTDIANLKPEHITGNKIEYIRQKTGKKIKVLLIPDTIKFPPVFEPNFKMNNF